MPVLVNPPAPGAGASIITGIEPDVEKGLRSDPSAVICKCVVVRLH